MYIVIIAWLYVALMMAVAESQHPDSGWLGAIITFVLYGLAPMSLVVYLMRTPHRRQKAREAEAAANQPSLDQTDGSGHAAGDPLTTERKEG